MVGLLRVIETISNGLREVQGLLATARAAFRLRGEVRHGKQLHPVDLVHLSAPPCGQAPIRSESGQSLFEAQLGQHPRNAKPRKGFAWVLEVRDNFDAKGKEGSRT